MNRGAPRAREWVAGLLVAGVVGCANALPERAGPAEAGAASRFPTAWGIPASAVPVATARGGMVTSTDSVASAAGAEVLRRGGNAVDAAIATHFALAVVNPEAGNIGGGGFLVVRLAGGETAALDFREKAPLAATRDMFVDARGEPTGESEEGPLSSGVPGSVAGMWAAHQRYGTLPWAELLAPAIRLADGLAVHPRLAESLAEYEGRLRRHPGTAAALLIEGRAPRVGERLVQADLAATLRRIAEQGADGFYRGRTAQLFAEEMRRLGGIITEEDLAAYEPAWRPPVSFDYRGYTVLSMYPSSSGGVTIAEILNILEGYDLAGVGFHSPQHVHLFVEAAKRAFADRNRYLGDPDFVDMPLERMVSDEYARERRAGIARDRATPAEAVEPGLGPAAVPTALAAEPVHTTHYSVIDGAGNAVAVTTTLNSLYGNGITITGAGFLLNNEMDDFTTALGEPNQFGLIQGEANTVAPGKRMLSAMTPTIVLGRDGRVRFVTGSPGGPTIITTVAQTISNVIDFGMDVAEATAAPRIHHQHLPDVVRVEAGGLPPETIRALEAMGHQVDERGGYSGDVAAILVGADGVLRGAADPRGGGRAVGVDRFTAKAL